MSDEALNQVWEMAKKRAANEAARISKMREDDNQRHLDRCAKLEAAVLSRLEQAKASWSDKAVVDIGKQFEKTTSSYNPTISLMVRPLEGGGRSSCYFFTIQHDGNFHVYEGATQKNSLGHRIGLEHRMSITNDMIDKVLGIALDAAFKHTDSASKAPRTYALPR